MGHLNMQAEICYFTLYTNNFVYIFFLRFSGVLIGYDNLKFLQHGGNIMDDQPCLHFDIQGEFIIFQPTVGSVLQGTVNKIGQDFVGCLVHDCFNASVPKPRHLDADSWPGSKLDMGEKFTFEVTKMYNQHGVASFQGKINNERFVSNSITTNSLIFIDLAIPCRLSLK